MKELNHNLPIFAFEYYLKGLPNALGDLLASKQVSIIGF